MAKSGKERQADLAARHRAAGRVQRKIWAHPEDWARIVKYVERLNRHRERARVRAEPTNQLRLHT